MKAINTFETKVLANHFDYIAPDGSEIRLLPVIQGGGLVHCTLPAGKVSAPVHHKTVEELWYFISGEGEVWRKNDIQEEKVEVGAGVCLSIPLGTAFQFRNTGNMSLCFVIVTIPPWPGPDEAVSTAGKWPVDQDSKSQPT